MGFAILFVLVVGYMIFQDFWWLLWMPALAVAAMVLWLVLLTWKEVAAARQVCPVCNNWIQSVIMIDWAPGDDPLCTKHATRRLRIWDRELALNLPLSGSVRRSSKQKKDSL